MKIRHWLGMVVCVWLSHRYEGKDEKRRFSCRVQARWHLEQILGEIN